MKPIETIKVLVASVIAVMVMVGIARFSYTPMIPEMVAALGLSKSVVGMLATVNYAGYLTGAVLKNISAMRSRWRDAYLGEADLSDADLLYRYEVRGERNRGQGFGGPRVFRTS